MANSQTGEFIGAVFTLQDSSHHAAHAAAARIPDHVATDLGCGIMAVPERVFIPLHMRERVLTHRDLVAYFGDDLRQVRFAPELFSVTAAPKASVN